MAGLQQWGPEGQVPDTGEPGGPGCLWEERGAWAAALREKGPQEPQEGAPLLWSLWHPQVICEAPGNPPGARTGAGCSSGPRRDGEGPWTPQQESWHDPPPQPSHSPPNPGAQRVPGYAGPLPLTSSSLQTRKMRSSLPCPMGLVGNPQGAHSRVRAESKPV